MNRSPRPPDSPAQSGYRWLLLLLILLSFARVIWRLDAKSLWFDESLSLQRAEEAWPDLLAGRLLISDGGGEVVTYDQHPPGYFAVLGLVVRLAGTSTFALRLPAAAGAVLLVPAVWALARRLVRLGAVPAGTAGWSALLIAFSPFYLWYGQETRMYTIAPLLAVLSTYLLLRWSAASGGQRRWLLVAYAASLAAFISTHYYSLFLLPVHAGIVYMGLSKRSRPLAIISALALLAAGAAIGLVAVWRILGQAGAGTNFSPVSVRILSRDLLNAFSLGPSADVAAMLWLDLFFALLALLGAGWGMRSRERLVAGGWILPAWVLVPPMLMVAAGAFQPAYMTARHMSLIGPAFLLLVGAGVTLLGGQRRWLAWAAAAVLLIGMGYGSYRYYEAPQYDKGDMAGLGAYLRDELQPGDLILMSWPSWLRLYAYYLPLEQRGVQGVEWRVVPGLDGVRPELFDSLEQLRRAHPRIWLVNAEDPVREWMRGHAFLVRDVGFESPLAELRLELFVPERPVQAATASTPGTPVDVLFGDRLRLRAYEMGQALPGSRRAPVTLYWQATAPIDDRLKYVLALAREGADGPINVAPVTEREPYDGFLPTTAFPVGEIVVERTDVALPPSGLSAGYALALQLYDAEGLEKLPVVVGAGGRAAADGHTALLPIGAP